MRFIALGLIALHMLAVAVLASAHNDTAWSRLAAERSACLTRVAASPEFQALWHRLQGVANSNKATPTEAAQMTRFHQDYLRPCQEIDLEIAWRTHPSLAKLYNAATAQADANIARLVSYQISWGEYVRNGRAIRIDLNDRLAAAKVALQLPSLNGLDLSTN
jgi:hypothetical protein